MTVWPQPQDREEVGVLEPRAGERAERGVVLGQLADHVGLGAGVREDVEEIVDDHREVGVGDAADVVHEAPALLGAYELVERPLPVLLALLYEQPPQELLLVLVLAALLVVVEPQVGHQARDGQRHQSGEDGVARVLRGGGQDGAVELVGGHVVVAAQPPLVVAEVVDQQQRGLGVPLGLGEDLRAHERVRHHGRVVRAAVDPVAVVAAHEFAELLVGFALLVGEHLADARIGRVGQLDLPPREAAVERAPVGERVGHLEPGGEAPEFGAVVGRGLLGDEPLLVYVLLDREQHLVRIHGFDKVVGDLRTHGLVHDVLLLALGDHDHGRGGAHLLDLGEGFEAGHAGHHLVEYDQVVGRFRGHVDGVVAVVAGLHLVAFLPEEEHVGLEQLHFVVYPEYLNHSACADCPRKSSFFPL